MGEAMGAGSSTSPIESEPTTAVDITPERTIQLLSQGHLALLGQIPYSSNVIFLASVEDGDLSTLAVYKPRRGETPLWDFRPGTLCLREVAAYVLSQALGWPLIPPTVLREGPYGPGALQLYVDMDPTANYFTLGEKRRPDLLPVALFDVLANNADRKGGHLLLDHSGRIWAIDNALTFHPAPKLRTVIWDLAGEPVPERYLGDLHQVQELLVRRSELRHTLDRLLAEDEVIALQTRLVALLETPVLPHPDPAHCQIPWPVV